LAGCGESDDEPPGFGATELVSQLVSYCMDVSRRMMRNAVFTLELFSRMNYTNWLKRKCREYDKDQKIKKN
jgi:hypothetical protein